MVRPVRTLGVATSMPLATYLLMAGAYDCPPSIAISARTPTARSVSKSVRSTSVNVCPANWMVSPLEMRNSPERV